MLRERVKILKGKLKEANNRIVQLLKQKIELQGPGNTISLSDTIGLYQHDMVYEARDAALVPLLPVCPEPDLNVPIMMPRLPPSPVRQLRPGMLGPMLHERVMDLPYRAF